GPPTLVGPVRHFPSTRQDHDHVGVEGGELVLPDLGPGLRARGTAAFAVHLADDTLELEFGAVGDATAEDSRVLLLDVVVALVGPQAKPERVRRRITDEQEPHRWSRI